MAPNNLSGFDEFDVCRNNPGKPSNGCLCDRHATAHRAFGTCQRDVLQQRQRQTERPWGGASCNPCSELGDLPNKPSIEGRTDSQPYAPSASCGNWGLSADRASAARRVMQSHGIRQDQITQVRGLADQRLRKPDAPLDPANRRISVIVQYILKNNDDKLPSDETAPENNLPATGESKPAAKQSPE